MYWVSKKTDSVDLHSSITSLSSLPHELSAKKLKNTIYLGFSSIKYQLGGKRNKKKHLWEKFRLKKIKINESLIHSLQKGPGRCQISTICRWFYRLRRYYYSSLKMWSCATPTMYRTNVGLALLLASVHTSLTYH